MDKQKQIEEIQQFLLSASCNWWKTYPNGKDKSEYVAECFYNAGYRKVCEPAIKNGEVVGFVNGADYVPKNLFLFGISNTRKETAEKFSERLKDDVSEDNELHEALNVYLKRDYFEYIDEIAKELTGGLNSEKH